MTDTDTDDFNRRIVEEFRANGGTVGGPFEGSRLALVHHRGARTGTERVNPLAYRPDGDSYVVFGSAAGADQHPDWYHNLKANPETTVEVGTQTIDVTAREAAGDERERLWAAQKSESPQFAEYEKATERVIPVIVLDPR
jgi:deazaflavin-dependent oxidoreductase (nitroreductase family)